MIYFIQDRQQIFHTQPMDYNSRVAESKQYQTGTLRESYNSNNMQRVSSSSQIVDQLRRKYDTPTRRQLKQIQTKALADKPQNYNIDNNLKKSTTSSAFGDNSGGINSGKWGVTLGQSKFVDMSPGFKKENVHGEEETIFRKIKEMKDSLLHKNQKVKTTKSIYEPRYSEKVEIRTNDNRVENIDKINSKIQQILSCLKQSQSKSPNLTNTQNEPKGTTQFKSNSKMTIDNSTKTVYTSYNRTSQFTDGSSSRPPLAPDSKAVQVKNTTSIYQEEKNKYKMTSPASRNVVQSFEISSNRQGSKVKSFINSVQKQNTVGMSKYQMKNGKKLDDEISKIQSKIQQFEAQKRKLNIQFKPYSHSTSKSTTNLTKRSYTIDKQTRPPLTRTQAFNTGDYGTPNVNHKRTQETYARRISGAYDKYIEKQKQKQRNTQTDYSTRISFEPKKQKTVLAASFNVEIAKKSEFKDYKDNKDKVQSIKLEKQTEQNSLFKLKLIPVESEKNTTSSRVQARMLSDDFRRKTDEGIIDRKKKLTTDQSSRPKANIKKLVQKLSEQATLDEKFRNNKLYFQSSMQNGKWDQLEQQLKRKGVKLDKQKLQKAFKVTDQQNNPFFSVRESQASIPALAISYLDSEKHWNEQLYKKIQRQNLLNQDLSMNSFDLQKKGYIVLEDIVRFLNMQTGTFYRNRDLYLILRRISQQQKISFEQLISTFCK